MRFNATIANPQPVGFYDASPTAMLPLGTRVFAESSDFSTTAGVGNGGGGEFVYVKAAGTFIPGRCVHVTKDWVLLDMPTTANTGRPVAVAISNFSSTNMYGWVMVSGMCPIATSTAATAGAVYMGSAAGQVTPSAANGKQILNAWCLIAADATFTKVGTTKKGSKEIKVSDVGGLYLGLVPSGTGIASGTIEKIDAGGQAFNNSAVATASGTVTVTFTHTGYGIFHISHPFVQGQAA